MCKKQTSASHSSTEPEVILLDAGLRMDGLLALDLWDLSVEVLGTTPRIPKHTQACTRETGLEIQSTQDFTSVGSQRGPIKQRFRTHLSEEEDNEALKR